MKKKNEKHFKKIVTGSEANSCDDVFRFLWPAKQNTICQRMCPWPHQMEVGLLSTSIRPYCVFTIEDEIPGNCPFFLDLGHF